MYSSKQFIYSILMLSTTNLRGIRAEAPSNFAKPAPNNQEAAMVAQALQSNMALNNRKFNEQIAECQIKALKGSPKPTIEGVVMVPRQENSAQAAQMVQEQRNECITKKIQQQKALVEEMKRLVNKAGNLDPSGSESKPCVRKLNMKNKECFTKNAIKKFYSEPVWQILIHDNVGQIWYKKKLVYMVVAEFLKYTKKESPLGCFTAFPNTSLAAKQNALGNIVSVVGKPKVPTKGKKCRPCSEFSVGGKKSYEGEDPNCSYSCDPMENLLSSSPDDFVKAAKPDRTEPKKKPTEEEKSGQE
jgi:Polar tube protein 2 from Microsporidia